jgi:hypothetical protein
MLQTLLFLVVLYATVGVLFTVAFVTVGVGRIDPAARGAPLSFRMLIFPASTALWPLLAVKWLNRAATVKEKSSP